MVFALAVIGNRTGGRGMAATLIPMMVVLLFYIPSGVFMWRYAASIRRLQDGGGLPALEEALASQKSFWKYVGVLALVMMGLYFVVIVVGVGVGMFQRR
jgi:hypothetical protein